MNKHHRLILLAGFITGLAALGLTAAGNPANMGFCIACFLRDIAGGLGMHSAAKVQYIRPEIIGLVLGALLSATAGREFEARAGSAPALRFVLGMIVMVGALAFLGCPLRMVLRLARGRPYRRFRLCRLRARHRRRCVVPEKRIFPGPRL